MSEGKPIIDPVTGRMDPPPVDIAALGLPNPVPSPAPIDRNEDPALAMIKTHGVDVTQPADPPQPPREPPTGGDDRERPPDPGPCPITPLGRANRVYVFATPAGEIVHLKANELCSTPGLMSVCDGKTQWLEGMFPMYSRTGDLVRGAFQNRAAATYLMQQCAKLPLWDAQAPIRGRGVWPSGGAGDPASSLIVHCGDAVWLQDGARWVRPGFRQGQAIYPAMPAIAALPDEGCGPAVCDELVALLSTWTWEHENAPLVVAGWIACGALGAAKPWNPHVLIVSEPGSGKSLLATLLESALPLVNRFNEFSPVGVRQSLSCEARPLVLDEAEGGEGDAQHGGAAKTIEVVRRLSGEEGLRSVRGSAEGTARATSATGQAAILAVLPPDLKPQDRTRFTRLDLLPLPADADPDDVKARIKALAAEAPGIWARMVDRRPAYLANLALIRAVLARRGCTPRQQDQPGALLAGYATLARDEGLDELAAERLVKLAEFIVATEEDDVGDTGPQRCIGQLLGSALDAWSGGIRRTTGQILACITSPADFDLVNALAAVGVKVAFDAATKERVGVWVANRYPALDRIYAGTPWAGGRWSTDLRRLAGAAPCERAGIRIGGSKVRAWFIPNDHLPAVDEDQRLFLRRPSVVGGTGPP